MAPLVLAALKVLPLLMASKSKKSSAPQPLLSDSFAQAQGGAQEPAAPVAPQSGPNMGAVFGDMLSKDSSYVPQVQAPEIQSETAQDSAFMNSLMRNRQRGI